MNSLITHSLYTFCVNCPRKENVYFMSRLTSSRASQVVLLVNNSFALQHTQVQSLDQEDPLEEEMTTHSNIFAGKFYGQKSLGHKRVRHD